MDLSLNAPSSKTLAFIQEKFGEYYRDSMNKLRAPSEISKREFGFLTFKERIMVRHRSFGGFEELLRFIQFTVPSDCYHSAAYYENPALEMDRKGWLGADLIFDVDADHLPTECKARHDKWLCLNCQLQGRGTAPDRCSQCGSQKFREDQWFCEECLKAAKLEALKLVDMLLQDFGLSLREVQAYFSGHRGYHVHGESDEVKELDQVARKEIADYVMGLGLNLGYHGFKDVTPLQRPLVAQRRGWHRRVVKGLYDLLSTASENSLEKLGIRRSLAGEIVKNRDWVLRALWGESPLGAIREFGPKSWERLLRGSVNRQVALVDSVVTTDAHRLIRLPGSLHGKTGLMKAPVETGDLEAFDPLKASIAFRKGSVRVYVKESSQFRLGDETYGPFKETKAELPTAAALLLMCKGVGFLP